MNHFNFALNGKLLEKVCNNKLNFYRAKLNSSLQFKFITIFIFSTHHLPRSSWHQWIRIWWWKRVVFTGDIISCHQVILISCVTGHTHATMVRTLVWLQHMCGTGNNVILGRCRQSHAPHRLDTTETSVWAGPAHRAEWSILRISDTELSAIIYHDKWKIERVIFEGLWGSDV